jgi:hypothetical protein
MKRTISRGAGVAAFVALGMVAFAQTTAQQGAAPQTQTPRATAGEQKAGQVTVVGCIQSESEYRKAQDAGKGGVAGSGVGAGNEFVLINASTSTGAGASGTAGTSGTAAGSATSTAGSAGAAYELTGSGEGQAAKFVGKRVEITGMIKAAETTSSGAATGGPTAGAPPSGVDVTSKDLKLRELEVSSVREATGSCS